MILNACWLITVKVLKSYLLIISYFKKNTIKYNILSGLKSPDKMRNADTFRIPANMKKKSKITVTT